MSLEEFGENGEDGYWSVVAGDAGVPFLENGFDQGCFPDTRESAIGDGVIVDVSEWMQNGWNSELEESG